MSQKERIGWHEYFMNICDVVAQRATCDRRAVGSVAVKDNRILTTGYNGSPPGAVHCIDPEVFYECPRCKTKYENTCHVCTQCLPLKNLIEKHGGHELEHNHCQRVIHSEINVIAQAARDGVALSGATLYCNTKPCYTCFKIIVSAGIQEVIWRDEYGELDPRIERLACEIDFNIHQFEPSKI